MKNAHLWPGLLAEKTAIKDMLSIFFPLQLNMFYEKCYKDLETVWSPQSICCFFFFLYCPGTPTPTSSTDPEPALIHWVSQENVTWNKSRIIKGKLQRITKSQSYIFWCNFFSKNWKKNKMKVRLLQNRPTWDTVHMLVIKDWFPVGINKTMELNWRNSLLLIFSVFFSSFRVLLGKY